MLAASDCSTSSAEDLHLSDGPVAPRQLRSEFLGGRALGLEALHTLVNLPRFCGDLILGLYEGSARSSAIDEVLQSPTNVGGVGVLAAHRAGVAYQG